MTEQVLVDYLAQPQTGQAASKSTSNRTEHGTRADTGRPGNDTDLHANTATDQSTGRAGRDSTTDSARHGTDSATDTLAVIGVHHPLGSAAGTKFGHRGFLMRQAS
ncbi:hypothetical protein SAMN05216217_10533 [Halopseudomonas yangmingensis]|uniref:Uncharacterized protein n=1 Tax=Halopseudomonas yangmingensis TaxID=1720063 RepID=A0A1I4QU49_9GAMM|nr:hypothetical protein SAMN05216217_10533 [Halopseudomonas yangmingensis]